MPDTSGANIVKWMKNEVRFYGKKGAKIRRSDRAKKAAATRKARAEERRRQAEAEARRAKREAKAKAKQASAATSAAATATAPAAKKGLVSRLKQRVKKVIGR